MRRFFRPTRFFPPVRALACQLDRTSLVAVVVVVIDVVVDVLIPMGEMIFMVGCRAGGSDGHR
eukprot:7708603-Pyramimonas_sp.AAC.1